MKKIDYLVDLPYDSISVFFNSFNVEVYTQEFKSSTHFSRIFDFYFENEKNTKFRLETEFYNDEEMNFSIDFSFKIFYKNAYNSDFEKMLIFKHLGKFKELTFLLETQIHNYMDCCELYKIEAIISETVSEKVKDISLTQIENMTDIFIAGDLFKKYVDTGIEQGSSDSFFPEKFMNNSSGGGSFTEQELSDAKNIFESISSAIKSKFLDINPSVEVKEKQSEILEEENFTSTLSVDKIMELVDESLDNGDVDSFMYYSEMLKDKKL